MVTDKLNTQRLVIMQNISTCIMKYNQDELDKLAKSLTNKTIKIVNEERKEYQGNKVGQMINSVNMKLCLNKFHDELIKTGMSFRED